MPALVLAMMRIRLISKIKLIGYQFDLIDRRNVQNDQVKFIFSGGNDKPFINDCFFESIGILSFSFFLY